MWWGGWLPLALQEGLKYILIRSFFGCVSVAIIGVLGFVMYVLTKRK